MSKFSSLPEETRDGRLIQHAGVGDNVDHQNDASADPSEELTTGQSTAQRQTTARYLKALGWATGIIGQSSPTELDRASPFQPAWALTVDKGGLHGYVSVDDFVVPPVQDKAQPIKGRASKGRASKGRASKRPRPLEQAPAPSSKCPRPLSYALSAFDEELLLHGGDTFVGLLGEDADPPTGAFDSCLVCTEVTACCGQGLPEISPPGDWAVDAQL
ncbi:hypothetical protein T484DRAFT_3629418 [Baffinella frigidus]|nr:hypothetical protein T484DRAFT_3629418 [Cryptophyta sp. CCMP2293]